MSPIFKPTEAAPHEVFRVEALNASLYKWGAFRLWQFNDHTRWLPGGLFPDQEIAKAGYKLAGPGRFIGYINSSDINELLGNLLQIPRKDLSQDLVDKEKAILERCPYMGYLPPIDLDPTDVDKNGNKIPREILKAMAVDAARAMNKPLAEVGFFPDWHTTGGKGVHGDMNAFMNDRPCVFTETEGQACEIYGVGEMLATIAKDVGIHLVSEHRKKSSRPQGVLMDDTMFTRSLSSRNILWRLSGSARADGTGRKERISLD